MHLFLFFLGSIGCWYWLSPINYKNLQNMYLCQSQAGMVVLYTTYYIVWQAKILIIWFLERGTLKIIIYMSQIKMNNNI